MQHARVILITGASSGIGRATFERYARQDAEARFVLVARRGELLEEIVGASHAGTQRAEVVAMDLTTPDAPAALARHITDTYGRLDVLVNNAGVGSSVPFEDASAGAATDRMLALNVRTPIALAHELLPMLEQRGGVIVNVASVAGLVGQPTAPVYSATKFAIVGFSESLRARLAHRGVHVACVHPGPVPTPGWPHERLLGHWWSRLATCDADAIARDVVRCAEQRRASTIRPGIYRAVPPLRALAPGIVRRILRARRTHEATSSAGGR